MATHQDLTNPEKLVDIALLDYFRDKCDAKYIPTYATVTEAENAANELT